MKPTSLFLPSSHCTTEDNFTGSWRYLTPRYNEKTAPCSAACPAGEDIGRIEMLTVQGYFKEAWETILWENPFPGICGRICYHPCERTCNRGQFDAAVSIRSLERFLADMAERYAYAPPSLSVNRNKEKITILGAGPAGLSAAHFLARLGYDAEIYESMPEPGGILRYGLPRFRLPFAVLQAEIKRLQASGVQIRCGEKVSPKTFAEIRQNRQAVMVACGHSRMPGLAIPGEDLPGVKEGLDFLRRAVDGKPPALSGTSAVIGGGNTAIDVARTLIRIGCRAVIYYRRRREDMPAFLEEVELALEEGVELVDLSAPVRIEKVPDGYRLTLQRMKPSKKATDGRVRALPIEKEQYTAIVQHVFKAIGFGPAEPWYAPMRSPQTLQLAHSVLELPDKDAPVVYVGDLVNPTKSVVDAVASGKEAAMAIDTLFRKGKDFIPQRLKEATVGSGPSLSMEIYCGGERAERSSHIVRFNEINADYFQFAPRLQQPRLLNEERKESFDEIDLKISTGMAIREAERCFNCGLCNQCDNCRIFCPDLAISRNASPQGRNIDYNYCKGCGICVTECPRNAMVLTEEERE